MTRPVSSPRRRTSWPKALSRGFNRRAAASQHLLAAPVEVFPAAALLDDGLEVFEPDDAVLDRVFDDGAGQAGGDVARAQRAVAVVGRRGQAAGDDRDRLGGGEGAARRLQPG